MTKQFHDAIKKGKNENVARVNIAWQQFDKQLTDMDDGTYAIPGIDVDGGTLDGVTTGANTPAPGTFTTLGVTGDLNLGSVFSTTLITQGVAASATDLILFDKAVLDSNSDFDVETGLFTPSMGGWYILIARLEFTANAAAKVCNTIITKNDSVAATSRLVTQSGTVKQARPLLTIQQANGVTDNFGVKFFNGDAVQITITGTSAFMGFRIF